MDLRLVVQEILVLDFTKKIGSRSGVIIIVPLVSVLSLILLPAVGPKVNSVDKPGYPSCFKKDVSLSKSYFISSM